MFRKILSLLVGVAFALSAFCVSVNAAPPRPGEFRHKQIRRDPRRRAGASIRHRPNYVKRSFRYGARPVIVVRREPLFLSALRILSTFFVKDNSFRPHRINNYANGGYDEINLSPVGRGYYNGVPIDAYVDEYGLMYMESDYHEEPLFSAIINNETDEQMTYDEFMEEIE